MMTGMYYRRYGKVLLLFWVLVSFFAGCSDKEEKSPAKVLPKPVETKLEQKMSLPQPSVVTIPENISSAWVAIRIEVAQLNSGNRRKLEIAIGSEKVVADDGLRVRAISFLPAFHMDGHEITSRSNDLENPAAQIEVYDGEKQIFKGWLFSLYPTTHAFTHPRYSLTLVEGVAADKE